MSKAESVETEFKVEEVDGKVIVSSQATEVYTPERFQELLQEKRHLCSERKKQILGGKARLMEIEDGEKDEDIQKFIEQYNLAAGIIQKEKIRENLSLLETDYANLEKETLQYENYLRSKGKLKE